MDIVSLKPREPHVCSLYIYSKHFKGRARELIILSIVIRKFKYKIIIQLCYIVMQCLEYGIDSILSESCGSALDITEDRFKGICCIS